MREIAYLAVSTICAASAAWVLLGDLGDQNSQPHQNVKSEQNVRPELELVPDAMRFSAGQVRQRQKVIHDFTLENRSRRVLILGEPKSDCGCTVGRLQATELKSGQTTKLSVTMDTGLERELMRKRIVVPFNRKDESTGGAIVLLIEAEVQPDFDVLPQSLRFATNRSSKQSVIVKPVLATQLVVQSVRSNESAITARIDRVQDNEIRIQVDFDSTKWKGTAGNCRVSIHTNSETQPVFNLEVAVAGKMGIR